MKLMIIAAAILLGIAGTAPSIAGAILDTPEKSARDIYIYDIIDDSMAESVHVQLAALNLEGKEDITLHIKSFGGSVISGLRIYDDMMESAAKVNTVCESYCMSMAAVLLAAGQTREATKNSTIMIHEVSFGVPSSKLTDVEIIVQEGRKFQAAIDGILVKHTGLPLGIIKQLESHDNYMTSEQAKGLRFIDSVREYKR